MSDELQRAIEAIQGKIKTHLDEIIGLKRAANALCKITGKDPLYPDAELEQGAVGPTRADAYYGKPLSTAAREYLEFRKQACAPEEILRGLEQGGFDFEALGWKGEHKLRSLSVSLAKNTAMFRRLPNGMFGLNSWYQDSPTIKRRSKASTVSGATAQAQEQPKEESQAVSDEEQAASPEVKEETSENEAASVTETTEAASEA